MMKEEGGAYERERRRHQGEQARLRAPAVIIHIETMSDRRNIRIVVAPHTSPHPDVHRIDDADDVENDPSC